MNLGGAYNGLSFGPGTAYRVSTLRGLFDLDGVNSNDLPKSVGGGFFPGDDRPRGRSVLLGLTLLGDTPAGFVTLVNDLVDATDPEGIPDELPLQLLGSTVYVMARPRQREIPIDAIYAEQTTTLATVQFFCSTRTITAGVP